ncbi:MAG: hypothetical protein JST48_04305 [Bacteroidetes bacterium]|nr:hypothetical protein [Bacteroidota bacterium]
MKSIVLLFLLGCFSLTAQDRVFVFLHHLPNKPELPQAQLDSLMKGHFASMKQLAADGRLLVAGPFEGGGGIFIFNSKSVNEVNQWLQNDPGVRANRWKVEVLPYRSRTGMPRQVKGPYQMTDYQFIRFSTYIAKFNIGSLPGLMKKHDDYLNEIKKSGNVVAEGVFGENDGGILVMKGTLDPRVIEADPAVLEGLLELDVKKWYVAKGSFGEP